MTISAARLLLLTEAAETYERLRIQGGVPKGEAFRDAMASIARSHRGKAAPVVPPEVPALIESVVAARVGEGAPAVLQELRHGESQRADLVQLRDEVAWVLKANGYGESLIGLCVNRDRTSVFSMVAKFEKRLASDELLRARVEKLYGRTTARAA